MKIQSFASKVTQQSVDEPFLAIVRHGAWNATRKSLLGQMAVGQRALKCESSLTLRFETVCSHLLRGSELFLECRVKRREYEFKTTMVLKSWKSEGAWNAGELSNYTG